MHLKFNNNSNVAFEQFFISVYVTIVTIADTNSCTLKVQQNAFITRKIDKQV